MSPVQRVLDALAACDCKPKRNGRGWDFRCPAHEDHTPSAHLEEGDDGRALVHCQAGCPCEEIVARVGLKMTDLFVAATKAERIVKTYDYTDENGDVLFQVVRFDPKDFRQRRPDGAGGWVWNMANARRVLYRLPDLVEAVRQDETIYVVEGEKDADAINAIEGSGFIATTNAGGAGKWRPEYSETLRGARVVIVADKDEPGRKHALDVRHHLQGIAASVGVVEARIGKDGFDHLKGGHTLDEFVPYGTPAPSMPAIVPVNLYDESIKPTKPKFAVKNLLREKGLAVMWATPGGRKTHTAMTLCHEMLVDTGCGRLFGHPDLWIEKRWKRALVIACEESAGELREIGEKCLKGLGKAKLDGELLYLFAASAENRITTDDLPAIIESTGPYDAVILDSLTGLRPKEVNGQRVKWDLDNDAGNELHLMLRGLAEKHELLFVILHHSGKDGTSYRGGVDLWASTDTIFSLSDDDGLVKVGPEKVRGARKPSPFTLEPTWHADGSFTLTYVGTATSKVLSPTARATVAWFKGKGEATQAEAKAANLGAPTTIVDSIKAAVAAGLLKDTGRKVNGSPLYVSVSEGVGDEPDTKEPEK
ncbi:MAG TPA: AAA family ATPase [Candidatus Polarisedimenticolaceae bacterium]|nr:AAA family ATPase [Candidatus Polarisedimenticolaceae bacterium]